MEEKRYKEDNYNDIWNSIRDIETGEWLQRKDLLIDRLNIQDQKIKELQQELSELKQKAIVLEKAFELACDPRDDWGGKEYSGTEFDNYHDYFIAEAQKELAEIGGKDE